MSGEVGGCSGVPAIGVGAVALTIKAASVQKLIAPKQFESGVFLRYHARREKSRENGDRHPFVHSCLPSNYGITICGRMAGLDGQMPRRQGSSVTMRNGKDSDKNVGEKIER